jgi:hypothetical protein
MYEFSRDGRPPEDAFATTPPLDALLTFAAWADWTWLAERLEVIETWIAEPERATGLTTVGLVVLVIGISLFLASRETVLDGLSGSWLGALLLAQVGNPAWAWLMLSVAGFLVLMILMSVVIAWKNSRHGGFYGYEDSSWVTHGRGQELSMSPSGW